MIPKSLNPVFNAHFEFFNVQAQDVIKVEVSSNLGARVTSVVTGVTCDTIVGTRK